MSRCSLFSSHQYFIYKPIGVWLLEILEFLPDYALEDNDIVVDSSRL